MPDQRLENCRFWAYAATFGAMWGVVELTLGTFLRTLRIPLSGSVLACCACALLVAQRQVFPRRGITLATGLVAAACKSISPDGAILGPMIGITSEALVVELMLTLCGDSWLGVVLAGALSSLCPLSQKILTHLAYYGQTIVTLYLELFRRMAALVNVTEEHLVETGLCVLATLCAIGALAGLVGRWVGSRVRPETVSSSLALPEVNEFYSAPQRQPSAHAAWISWEPLVRRRDPLLLGAAILALSIQFHGALAHACGAFVTFFVPLTLLRPNAIRRMWRPKFWAITFLFALISGFFLGPRDLTLPGMTYPCFSSVGAQAGLLMILRCGLIFSLTSWISVALNRKTFLHVAQRAGLGNLGNAISAAFGIMPELRALMTHPPLLSESKRKASLRERFSHSLAVAACLAERSARYQCEE